MRIVTAIITVLLIASLALNYFLFRELQGKSSTISYMRSLNAKLQGEVGEFRPLNKTSDEEGERAAVADDICRIRQLPLKHALKFSKMDREKLESYIEDEIEEQYPGEKMEHLMRALVRFGFTDKGFDLKEKIVDLYTEQVGGLYDNDTDTLYFIEGAPATGSIARTFLAHEIVHALQDQHLGLDELPLKLKDNDDRVLACVALVEGDATVAMFQFYLSQVNMGTLADLVTATFTDSKEYSDAPDFIKENMMFPYVQGAAFVSDLFADGGWVRVNAVYGEPPASTEQIMHPEKYIGARDDPVPVSLPDLEILGWKKLEENVLGEFNIFVLLKLELDVQDAEEASEGWGGDRFGFYERDGRELLVWLSVWDTDRDAAEFTGSFRKFLEEARGLAPDGTDADGLDLTWSSENDIFFLGSRGRETLFISGSLGADVPAVRNAFGRFKTEEETHETAVSG